ncbi:MAG: hypothetical protein A2Z38_11740 [Planctomycetes bacterium RBG_19FT_COMBO_48_8]|nr:MAG: hypothetical protein A2Z38_11740 [Planctomycetes bacterium RBG_19FT_COMBO_48_8]
MDDLLLQIILARRNDDTEGWINILFVVVLAVFWAIGGIVKAKSRNPKTQDEQLLGKPVRKPTAHSSQSREQMLRQLPGPVGSEQGQRQQPHRAAQKPRMRFADLQTAVRKFAVEAEQAFQSQSGKKTPVLKPVLTEPQNLPKAAESTEPIGETVKRLQDKLVSEPAQMPESEYLSELLTDYADPEELRRAILHSEILGKPLSLRDYP